MEKVKEDLLSERLQIGEVMKRIKEGKVVILVMYFMFMFRFISFGAYSIGDLSVCLCGCRRTFIQIATPPTVFIARQHTDVRY